MSDDDFPSVTESDPVSDVNPDEMAKLMADIDDIDENLFKSEKKSPGSSTTTAKTPDKKTVKFEEKPKGKPRKNVDDDWDADDLLQSDEETVPARTKNSRTQQADTSSKKNEEKVKDSKSASPGKERAKDMLMKDLFSDTPTSPPKEANVSQETRRTKKKELLDDLFSSPEKSPAVSTATAKGAASSPSVPSGKGQTAKGDSKLPRGRKAKEEISFDDDEDLFKSLTDGPKSSRQKSETEGRKGSGGGGGKGSFLDSILTSPAQKESPTVNKPKSFVLDDKYKKGRVNKEDDLGFGGYAPSAGKSDSPRRRPPRKPVAKDEFDLFDSDMPPRRPRSVGKPFEIDDDDILGSIKTKRPGKESGAVQSKKATEGNKVEITPSKHTPVKESSKDWLSPGAEAKQTSASKTGSAGQEDWLALSLSASKHRAQSPSKEQAVDVSGQPPSKTTPKHPLPEASHSGTPSKTTASQPSTPAIAPPSHPSTPATVHPSLPPTPAVAAPFHQPTPVASYHTTPSMPSGTYNSMPSVPPSQVHNAQTLASGQHGGVGVSATQMVSSGVGGSSSSQVAPAQGSGLMGAVGYTPTPEFQQSLQLQDLLRQQQEAQMQAAAFAQQLRNQQEQIQVEMKERLQRQMQQQQHFQLQQQEYQTMLELLQRQQSEASLKQYEIMTNSLFNPSKSPVPPTSDDQHIKELQTELHASQLEVQRLEAQIKQLKTQHEEQLQLVEEVHRKKQQLTQELWEQSEARLRQNRDKLEEECRHSLKEAQVEKESLIATHEDQMKQLKVQWTAAVESVKEVYTNVIERMKAEHNTAIERLTELKDIEVKALISAQGHSKDIEVVMSQLEDNTQNLTGLSSMVNLKHENALELSKRSLEMKERQLKEFEANVYAARAEAESERARLNALVERLERRLVSQGSEVEQDRWKVAQERIQLETERAAIMEERKHMTMALQVERRELATARESLSNEHRRMVAAVARDKQEVARQQARLDAVTSLSSLDTSVLLGQKMSDEADLAAVSEERNRLKVKQTQLQEQTARLDQQKRQLEEQENELKDMKTKLDQERECFLKEKRIVEHIRDSSKKSHQEAKLLIDQQEAKIQEMNAKAASIQTQQLELEQLRTTLQQYMQEGLCTQCKTAGISDESGFGLARLPADGGESLPYISSKEHMLAPTTVLARLAEARKHELDHKMKRKLQMLNLSKEV
ncbi:uncharacterized protein LOC143020392 isoform X2 [Oratosquilla oratoria]|uniref:uncharacterized protein LOC143020392 isoform X2 n=1 Tax=Oratosquilla oratoria TaxID=337810 RepID=UPI003F75B05D